MSLHRVADGHFFYFIFQLELKNIRGRVRISAQKISVRIYLKEFRIVSAMLKKCQEKLKQNRRKTFIIDAF